MRGLAVEPVADFPNCRHVVIEQKGNEAAYGQPRDAALEVLRAWGMTPLEVLSGDWVMGW